MPDVRKQVRTLALRQPRYFDDRAWPTNAALVALALFVAGIVVLESRFAQPRPSSNMMWLQLLAIGAALAASLWAARVTGRAFTQRIKLCVSLSLLFHVGLLLAMHHHHLKLFVERTEPAEMAIVETRFEKDVPQEMFIQPPEVGEEKRPIEQPLATGKPQLATDRLTPERTTPELLDSIRQSHELPEPQSQPEPQLVRARRPEQAIAMRSEQTGRRSRRESEAAQANASAVELEATAAASATRATAEPSPAAQAQRLARAEAVTPLSEPMTEPVDAASVREALVAPRRESPTEPSPETVAMVPRERQSERPARIQQQAIANNDARTRTDRRGTRVFAHGTRSTAR
jgi:hypothetical protein